MWKGWALGQTHFDEIPHESQGMKTGPEVGSAVPDFRLPDQQGSMRDFSSVAGPKGALILFYRSANW
jgi:hypothetical protein